MPKSLPICAALVAATLVPSIVQARGKVTAAEKWLIAGCIHRSAGGKPWLEKALLALHDHLWTPLRLQAVSGSSDT